MRFSSIKKWAAVIGCICSGGLAPQASALSLTFDQLAFLGEFDRGGAGRDQEEKRIDQLAAMTWSTAFRDRGVTYTRSGNQFDALPAAEFAARVNHNHSGIMLDGTYDYLLARYGSGATVVWYVGGLTGNYDVPGSYGGRRSIHHYSLFRSGDPALSNGGSTPSNASKVADGGSACALLGLSLISLALLQRKFRTCPVSPTSEETSKTKATL